MIPWNPDFDPKPTTHICIEPQPTTIIIPKPPASIISNPPAKTFAQALTLTNLCEIPLSQLPQAVIKGDVHAIQIPEAEYDAGLNDCKHNLHGRVIWQKGSTPLTTVDLKKKLSLIWKNLSRWGIMTIGKGYFEFTFSNLEYVRRVRSVASWNLNPGFLKLFAWSKEFNPKYQQNTSAQIWVNFFGLSQEYWRKNILFSIASGVGSPICTDSITAKPMIERTFRQYARVLVDVDLTQPLRYSLLVEIRGFAFYVDLEYENVPDFCTHCRMIGHHIDFCKRWNNESGIRQDQANNGKKNPAKEIKKIFKQTKDGRKEQDKNKDAIDVEKEVIEVEEGETEEQGNNNEEMSAQKRYEAKGKATVIDQTPEDLLKLQDKQLEDEIDHELMNKALPAHNDVTQEDKSSQGSFVDATQTNGDSIEDTAQSKSNIVTTPVRVLKDMEFLAGNQS